MAPTPKDLVTRLLANTSNLTIVKELVAEDATYVSLNYNDADLTKIEPWCGTHEKAGPEAIYQTFLDVGRFWAVRKFEVITALGSNIFAAKDELPATTANRKARYLPPLPKAQM